MERLDQALQAQRSHKRWDSGGQLRHCLSDPFPAGEKKNPDFRSRGQDLSLTEILCPCRTHNMMMI